VYCDKVRNISWTPCRRTWERTCSNLIQFITGHSLGETFRTRFKAHVALFKKCTLRHYAYRIFVLWMNITLVYYRVSGGRETMRSSFLSVFSSFRRVNSISHLLKITWLKAEVDTISSTSIHYILHWPKFPVSEKWSGASCKRKVGSERGDIDTSIFFRSTHINGFNKCIYSQFRYLKVTYCYNLLHISAIPEI